MQKTGTKSPITHYGTHAHKMWSPTRCNNQSSAFFYTHKWSVSSHQLSIKTQSLHILVLLLHIQMFTTFKTAWIILLSLARTGWQPVIFMQKTDSEYLTSKPTFSMLLWQQLHHLRKYLKWVWSVHFHTIMTFQIIFWKNSVTPKMYMHRLCVCVSNLFHLKINIHIHAHINTHAKPNIMKRLSGG